MDITDLITFAWDAISSGVIGNASYDAMKIVFGDGFEQLSGYSQNGQRTEFEVALGSSLETNKMLREHLVKLASGCNVTNIITTRDIDANGPVIIGSHNQIG